MKFQSRLKLAHERCVPPSETIARLEAFVGSRHDFWIHEETVSPDLHWAAMFLEGLEFRSMGKGTTMECARAGALAEGAEWLAARATGNLPGYTWGREEDFPNAVRFSDLLGHVSNASPALLRRLRTLDEAGHWVDGFSLVNQATVKVPLEFVRLINGPSGKASGNTIEEAVIHAANEIFERRAHITVLRNRLVMPTIDPATIKIPVLLRQIEFLRSKGIEFTIKDLSFGGVLPCIAVYFRDTTVPPDFQFHHFFKVGASFDREEALIRTFTEYTQGRKAHEFIDLSAPDASRQLASLLDHDFRRIATLGNDCDNFMSAFMFGMVPYRSAAFLLEGETVPFDSGTRHADCLGDLQEATDTFDALGLDVIAIDLTDPDIGFPVVQLVVPGYSDVLPYHPPTSPALFRPLTRTEVLQSYPIADLKGL
jgi:ribosomal protein S12 methylthiotransferase accessory factor